MPPWAWTLIIFLGLMLISLLLLMFRLEEISGYLKVWAQSFSGVNT